MIGVFAEFILRDRVKAGITQARKEGRPHGRPPTVAKFALQVRALSKKGINKSAIARQLKMSRTSVRRFLGQTTGLVGTLPESTHAEQPL
jgi:DNA invertase Pin-like site-specific DNA recombinase